MDSFMPNALFSKLGNRSIKRNFNVGLYNIIPAITQEDIESKIKIRYFAKYAAHKRGDIYEIDGGQYSTIINNSFFKKTTINWIIRGKLEDTILTLPSGDNILIKGVISQNKALLALAEEQLSGITNHLRNYVEFWSGE